MRAPVNCFKSDMPPAPQHPDLSPDGLRAQCIPDMETSPVYRKPVFQTDSLSHLFARHQLESPTALLNTIIDDSEKKLPEGLVHSLYKYSPWVYEHCVNVAVISLMIAINLGYTNEALHNIGLGAFLHDIGKLMIPKAILEKQGVLDQPEMNYMRQHCTLGFGIIKGACLPEAVTAVILQHHERIDGSGYPYGLIGHHIHRHSQIAMVADVFDALTSHRPYRSAYDKDTALSILKGEACRFPADIISIITGLLK